LSNFASESQLFIANWAGETYVHGSVGSVFGAFAVSLLGSIYTWLWNGYAFAAMIPGVLLLVPTGLTAVGGLAQNYSSNDDQFSSGLNTGLAMIQCEFNAKNISLFSAFTHHGYIHTSEHCLDNWAMSCCCWLSYLYDSEGILYK
jgi:uncharacterized membrane protein YjjB (DUF3815 family)